MTRLVGTDQELMDAVEDWRPFLVRRLGDVWRADDALQLVREQVWYARDRFDPQAGSPRLWVGGFARLIAMERLRALHGSAEISGTTEDIIGAARDAPANASVDDERRLLQIIARHVNAADWEVISTHAYNRSTVSAEAKLLGISVNAYRAALQRVQSVAETVRAVLVLSDTGHDLSRESLKGCVSSRLGVADVLPWVDDFDATRAAAAELRISVSVARNRLSAARRLLAVAESVAGGVSR